MELNKREITRLGKLIDNDLQHVKWANEGYQINDERMFYIRNDFLLFLRYLYNLSKQDTYRHDLDETSNIMIESASMFKKFDELGRKTQESKIIRDYIKNINPRKVDPATLDKFKKEKMIREYKENLVSIVEHVKQVLDIYGIIPEQLRREKNSLINFGLSYLVPSDETVVSEMIDSEFSPQRLKNNSEIELLAKGTFWINKIIKQIHSNQAAMMLQQNEDTRFDTKSIDRIEDKTKYASLKKMDIIRRTFDLFSKYHSVSTDGISISDFFTYYDSISNPEFYKKEQKDISKKEMEERIERRFKNKSGVY